MGPALCFMGDDVFCLHLTMSTSSVAAIVLAAGSSSRLGSSKQLLSVGDKTLLERTIHTILAADVSRVMVVLGSNAIAHQQAIEKMPVSVVVNSVWTKGMGSSLRVGVEQVLKTWPETSALLVFVCDQPLLSMDHVKSLVACWQREQAPAVASFYQAVAGVPVLFDRALFPKLLTWGDQAGARQLIHDLGADVKQVKFPEGAIDIDTQADYENFLRST